MNPHLTIIYLILHTVFFIAFGTGRVSSQTMLSHHKQDSTYLNYRSGDLFIRINEICAQNSSIIADGFGEFEDWIELHNAGEAPVDLSYLYMSDDDEDPFKWSLSAFGNEQLQSGGYILLFADDQPEQGEHHLNFNLDVLGEYVGIFDSEGNVLDEIYFGELGPDISFGRLGDGDQWNYFNPPSPGEPNSSEGLLGILAPVSFDHSDGFYSTEQLIALNHPDSNAEIYYTTDASEPNPFSNLYEEPISVEPGRVIRAKAFRIGFLESSTHSVSILEDAGYSLDAISLVAVPQDLFGDDGIYEFPYNGLEKPLEITLIEQGQSVFKQNGGMRIHAPDNRDQKSMRLYARSEYGNPRFEHPFFSEKGIESFKRLILRNGGNDGVERNHTGLRDPLISRLYSSIQEGYGYAAWRPINVFINGEYWGIYSLRERQDEHFIESNYGYTPDQVNYLERSASSPQTYNAISGTWDDFNAMEQTAIDLDLSEGENYAIMQNWMNIENYVDYQSLEIFICNQDWLSNNMKFWRTYTPERKWEWIIWDTDWGFGTFYPAYEHGFPDWDALNFALSNWGGWTSQVETELLQNLVENEEFRNYFGTRAADLTNSYLRADRIQERLAEMAAMLEPDIPFQFERWGSSSAIWNSDIGVMNDFIEGRQEHFLQHFAERFEWGDRHIIHLDVEPEGAGYIEVNTIYTDELPWSGLYYEGLPVELKAVANPGFAFSGWSDDENGIERDVFLEEETGLTAIFEEVFEVGTPVINEIMYNPSEEWACGEWVELYNPGTLALSLNDWQIGNDEGELYSFSGDAVIPPLSYAILSLDQESFEAYYPNTIPLIGEWETSLSDGEGSVFLLDPELTIVDQVSYASEGDWPSSPNGMGQSLELLEPELNNGIAQNWFAREEEGGTPGEQNEYSVNVEDDRSPGILVYPNPCKNHFRIVDAKGFKDYTRLELFNSLGQKVLEYSINATAPFIEIQFPENTAGGIFTYRLSGAGELSSGRILRDY